ncbi:hypothetical protein B9Z55_000619 [Caenorhabditis nigoni]|nr:hypothetical protein B9Z55_000619 [Caenorhabditis nigoni]
MKKLIKSSQEKRIKNIRSIRYSCDGNKVWSVDILFRNNWREDLLEIVECEKTKNDYFQLNVFGTTIDFRICDKYKLTEAYFNPHENTSAIQSIHNYFLHFFGDSMEYLWRTSDCENIIPQLENISACIRVWNSDSFSDMKTLENVFSTSPNLKWISMFPFKSAEPLSPDSKFYRAESIETVQIRHNAPAVFSHFKGRQAFLKCIRCEILNLIEFVSRWKSGEAFQKLEYLKMTVSIYEVHENQFLPGMEDAEGYVENQNFPQILNIIGAKHIEETKKPPTHTLPKIYEYFNHNTTTDPIISYSYVVRESDNRVASILIEENMFSFGVWDMTEEEFLSMLE